MYTNNSSSSIFIWRRHIFIKQNIAFSITSVVSNGIWGYGALPHHLDIVIYYGLLHKNSSRKFWSQVKLKYGTLYFKNDMLFRLFQGKWADIDRAIWWSTDKFQWIHFLWKVYTAEIHKISQCTLIGEIW